MLSIYQLLDPLDVRKNLHQRLITIRDHCSNVVYEPAPSENIAYGSSHHERFCRFNAQYFASQSKVRTDGFNNKPPYLIRSLLEPFHRHIAE
jgi:hypothetical protein